MNKTKILIAVIIVFLVVGVLVFAVQNKKATNAPTQTPPASTTSQIVEPTATTTQNIKPIVVTNIPESWKTYTNEEKRFGFAYPANWRINLNWKDNLKNKEDADQVGHVRVTGDGHQFGVTYWEHENDTNQFGFLEVYGDGYHLTMTSLDHGFGRYAVIQKTVPNIYISGKNTEAWETSFGDEIKLLVVVPDCNNLSFFIENFTSTSSDLIYQIISTAVCE